MFCNPLGSQSVLVVVQGLMVTPACEFASEWIVSELPHSPCLSKALFFDEAVFLFCLC